MNQVLRDIAADLAAIKDREEEMAKSGRPFQFAPMEPYEPSEAVLKHNRDIVEYHQRVKGLSFGQY